MRNNLPFACVYKRFLPFNSETMAKTSLKKRIVRVSYDSIKYIHKVLILKEFIWQQLIGKTS